MTSIERLNGSMTRALLALYVYEIIEFLFVEFRLIDAERPRGRLPINPEHPGRRRPELHGGKRTPFEEPAGMFRGQPPHERFRPFGRIAGGSIGCFTFKPRAVYRAAAAESMQAAAFSRPDQAAGILHAKG